VSIQTSYFSSLYSRETFDVSTLPSPPEPYCGGLHK
jgi:hypothetical protein